MNSKSNIPAWAVGFPMPWAPRIRICQHSSTLGARPHPCSYRADIWGAATRRRPSSREMCRFRICCRPRVRAADSASGISSGGRTGLTRLLDSIRRDDGLGRSSRCCFGNRSTLQQIELRLVNAAREMELWRDYRYTIISKSMEEDLQKFRHIMGAERYLSRRLKLS